MKADIHPKYVESEGPLLLRQHLHHPLDPAPDLASSSAASAIPSTPASRSWWTPAVASTASSAATAAARTSNDPFRPVPGPASGRRPPGAVRDGVAPADGRTMSLDPERRSGLLAVKLGALVREHWPTDAVDAQHAVPFPGGAARRDGDRIWVLLDEGFERRLGAALAVAVRAGAREVHLLVDDRGAAGLLARRAATFGSAPLTPPSVQLSRVVRSSPPSADPSPVIDAPHPAAELEASGAGRRRPRGRGRTGPGDRRAAGPRGGPGERRRRGRHADRGRRRPVRPRDVRHDASPISSASGPSNG